jgi:hypothetical protein
MLLHFWSTATTRDSKPLSETCAGLACQIVCPYENWRNGMYILKINAKLFLKKLRVEVFYNTATVIIPAMFRIFINNIGRFLLSPRKILQQCLLFRSFPSVCSLVWGPIWLNWFWRNLILKTEMHAIVSLHRPSSGVHLLVRQKLNFVYISLYIQNTAKGCEFWHHISFSGSRGFPRCTPSIAFNTNPSICHWWRTSRIFSNANETLVLRLSLR